MSAAFAVGALVGVVARLLPMRLSALPYVPNIVAATPWFGLVAAVALLFAVLGRRRVLTSLAVACLILVSYWQAPFFANAVREESPSSRSTSSGTTLRVMTCNVYKGRADAAQIVKLVREQKVQVLTLQETTADFVNRLDEAGIAKYLPYAKTASADGVYGNGAWSARPLANAVRDEVQSSASQMPAGTVSLGGGRTLRFVSVHTTAPVAGYWNQWKRSLDELAAMKSVGGGTYVFMGDFNATYDHAPFRNVLGDRFTDAARSAGRGLTFTWPANRTVLPPMFGIDHIVMDRGVSASDLEVHRIEGTDHAALLATLRVGE
ncbi:endonuclease/exonuclease/phosphatase family protein [Bifidobacterium sp. SMB2]|uniref:Endonuclease/exonuclease/phosphatase family protein n=2 Tax=Bifidobacterium TaxID=1678 RepID=A0ABX0C9A5_9BIFI|nr:endonuclease/exonuclease/phosphatase family protein [Bifidobacterium sp. SMB2]NEH11723.1 endonuclease/exonuclease/phosphatase family protein [Bifidobacterium saimiriisciurei]